MDSKLTSGKLQDIEVWIKMVKKGKKNKLTHFLNRWSVPYIAFKRYTDDEWLKILEFERKQEIERIKFEKSLKK